MKNRTPGDFAEAMVLEKLHRALDVEALAHMIATRLVDVGDDGPHSPGNFVDASNPREARIDGLFDLVKLAKIILEFSATRRIRP